MVVVVVVVYQLTQLRTLCLTVVGGRVQRWDLRLLNRPKQLLPVLCSQPSMAIYSSHGKIIPAKRISFNSSHQLVVFWCPVSASFFLPPVASSPRDLRSHYGPSWSTSIQEILLTRVSQYHTPCSRQTSATFSHIIQPQQINSSQKLDKYYIVTSVSDGRRGTIMAERRCRSELRLHVQIADYREQLRGKNIILVSLCRRLFHLGLCQHRRHRLQSEDRVQTGQASEASDLGEYRKLLNLSLRIVSLLALLKFASKGLKISSKQTN